LIEETGKYASFCVFAEGGTTNNTTILDFKKGGFFAERTVQPMFLKYKYNTLNIAYDTMEFLPLAILVLSWNFYTCELNIMPDFQPNDYLFEVHNDKGEERWEIIAWAV